MAGLTDKEKEALRLFKKQLEQEFSDQIQSIQLFGSKARGDATKFSDIDILVVMPKANFERGLKVHDAMFKTLLKTGVVLSPKVFTPAQVDDMRASHSVFWQSVEPDLVTL